MQYPVRIEHRTAGGFPWVIEWEDGATTELTEEYFKEGPWPFRTGISLSPTLSDAVRAIVREEVHQALLDTATYIRANR